MINIRCP